MEQGEGLQCRAAEELQGRAVEQEDNMAAVTVEEHIQDYNLELEQEVEKEVGLHVQNNTCQAATLISTVIVYTHKHINKKRHIYVTAPIAIAHS